MNQESTSMQDHAKDLLSAIRVPSYAQRVTRKVSISEAKASLSSLADYVAAGEEIIVSRSGKPLIKLVALTPEEIQANKPIKLPRKLGITEEHFKDFDWEEWDRLDEEMHKIWRKFGYMD